MAIPWYFAILYGMSTLETFENPQPNRDYTIRTRIPEFTCLCPKTGQPDFAELLIEYVPEKLCVELRSLKYYMTSFRDVGGFHEDLTNQILSDLVTLISPRYMRISAKFNVRGGIYTEVIVEHKAPNWKAQEKIELP